MKFTADRVLLNVRMTLPSMTLNSGPYKLAIDNKIAVPQILRIHVQLNSTNMPRIQFNIMLLNIC